jgi:two-component system response regulator FixJ
MSSQPILCGKVIAIVDDHDAFCRSLSAFIESHGAKALTFNSSHEFLRHLPSAACIIIDYYMPVLNGLELASELRARAYDAPIILLSAMSRQVPEHWATLGISDVLDKLSVGDELIRAIHRLTTRAAPHA